MNIGQQAKADLVMLRQLSGSLKYKRSVKFSGFKGIMSGYFKTNSLTNFVPAVAVKRRERVLFILMGVKCV